MNIILCFYGLFLIISGLTAFAFIGKKSKTALLSGGTTGLLSILVGYFYSFHNTLFVYLSILIPMVLFVIFSWRGSITFFKLIELIIIKDNEIKTKAIAFLIISLMAIVSIFTFAIELTEYIQISLLK